MENPCRLYELSVYLLQNIIWCAKNTNFYNWRVKKSEVKAAWSYLYSFHKTVYNKMKVHSPEDNVAYYNGNRYSSFQELDSKYRIIITTHLAFSENPEIYIWISRLLYIPTTNTSFFVVEKKTNNLKFCKPVIINAKYVQYFKILQRKQQTTNNLSNITVSTP